MQERKTHAVVAFCLRFIICAELMVNSLEALKACHSKTFCRVLLCERALIFTAATLKTHENWLHPAVPSLGTIGEFCQIRSHFFLDFDENIKLFNC
jgi:hypothetical protein